MRTEKPTPVASAVARFRSQVARARRGLASQPPAFRWSLVLGAAALLALLGYLASPVATGTVFLRSGQSFASGDIFKIKRLLDALRIDYRVDDRGRIEIAADRLEEAKTALAKVTIGPPSIQDLIDKVNKPDVWGGPTENEQRQVNGREEILGAMIRNLDGIISAYVTINRPKLRMGLRPGPGSRPTAFVWLETVGGREIPHKTVQSIQNIIVGSEADLKQDAVTVFDQKGRHYLVAGDSRYSTISATRAREEELGQRILEQIDWVDGVRVTVQLVPAPPSSSSAPTVPATVTVSTPATIPTADTPGSTVGVNTPLELEPEDKPSPTPNPAPAMTVAAASAVSEAPGTRSEVARVWVRVPRSYYFSKAVPDRDPSPDRLQEIVERTESLICEAVAHVVPPELNPPGKPSDVKIDTIPDDSPVRAPLHSQVDGEPHRPISWWWLPAAVAVGGLTVLLSALGMRMLALRRPIARPARVIPARPGRYRSDGAHEPGPGPAERVRELIRLNPEAAASVLHRWIGQGGAVR